MGHNKQTFALDPGAVYSFVHGSKQWRSGIQMCEVTQTTS